MTDSNNKHFVVRIAYRQHCTKYQVFPRGDWRGPFATRREAKAALWQWLNAHYPNDADNCEDGAEEYDFADGCVWIDEDGGAE